MAVFIETDEVWVGEGDGFARFIVRLSERSASAVSVDWETVAQSALSTDYGSAHGTLDFAPNEVEKVIEIPITNRFVAAEGLEFFSLAFSNPVGATVVDNRAIAFIVDNDTISPTPRIWAEDVVVDEGAGKAHVVVRLDAASTGNVSVEYATGNATASAESDYVARQGSLTFLAGEVTKTIAIDLVDGDSVESTENFFLRLSNAKGGEIAQSRASIVVKDDDGASSTSPTLQIKNAWVGEGDGFARFIVSLSSPTTSTVSVDLRTATGTAVSGDFGFVRNATLTFAPGEVSKTVVVEINNDTRVEALEQFYVDLTNATGAIIEAGTRGVATIVDNDAPAQATPLAALVPGATTFVRENADWIDVPIYLNAPSAGLLRLEYDTRGGTASEGKDFDGTSGTLVYRPGEVVKSVRVFLEDDQRFEKNETFVIDFKETSSGTSPSGLPFSTRVTISDDEAPIHGTSGVDRLNGTDFEDRIYGAGGNDVLRGGRGNDRLYGDAGNDKLYGDAGNDLINGGKGNDLMEGGAGEDELNGGRGRDRMSGDAGVDTFVFRSITESVRGSARDVIQDFSRRDDLIDLSDIDANASRRGDQKFSFIGSKAFSDHSGELRFKSGILSGDTDGDGRADFEIEVAGVGQLSAADFLL